MAPVRIVTYLVGPNGRAPVNTVGRAYVSGWLQAATDQANRLASLTGGTTVTAPIATLPGPQSRGKGQTVETIYTWSMLVVMLENSLVMQVAVESLNPTPA